MSSFATLFSSLLTIALLSFPFSSQSTPIPFILPIGKDPLTNLYYTSIGIGTPNHNINPIIDLEGIIIWYDCNSHYNSSTYHPISCDSKRCPYQSGCTTCHDPRKPGCTKDTCGATVKNPLTETFFTGNTGEDILFISHSIISGLISICTDPDPIHSEATLLKGFPKASKGVLGLARSKLSLPTQISLSSHNKIPNKFALCLPSSNKKGLGSLFIGGVPYQNIASKFQLTTILLVVNPFNFGPIYAKGDASYEYFIDVKSIKVGGKVLNFNSTLLKIDNNGNGGTKLRTLNSSTVLHSSIFKPLVEDFVKKASDKKINKVSSVAPYEACFDLSTIGRTSTGLDVPTIDLVLEKGVEWTIYGANSMILVNKKVACLSFVDAREEESDSILKPSIIIGGHILEDILLEFDLASSKLGFSSSLHLHNARCSYNISS